MDVARMTEGMKRRLANLRPFKRGFDERRNTPEAAAARGDEFKPGKGRPSQDYLTRLKALELTALDAVERVMKTGTGVASVRAAEVVLDRLHGRQEAAERTLRIIVDDSEATLTLPAPEPKMEDLDDDAGGEAQ